MLTIGALGLAATATGCGSSTSAADPVPCEQRRPPEPSEVSLAQPAKEVYLVVDDGSRSTNDVRSSYLPDMVRAAQRAAHSGALLYADTIGGQPRRTTDFPVRADFAGGPDFGGNERLAESARDCRARSLTELFRRLLRKDVPRRGTPLLAILALLAELAGEHRGATVHVVICTDGELIEPEYDARHERLTEQTLRRLVAEWSPRMDGLAGGDVAIVGVGRGSAITETQLADVRRLLDAVLTPSGTRLTAFTAVLPATYVSGP